MKTKTYRNYIIANLFVVTLFLSIQSFNLNGQGTSIFMGGSICPTKPWRLVFQDEFNGNSLDLTKWRSSLPWGRGWDGVVLNLDNDVEVSNGTLKLKIKKETVTSGVETKDYSAGLIYSLNTFYFGKFEMKAKLPTGYGLSGAFWEWGGNNTEIDNFEYNSLDAAWNDIQFNVRKWIPGCTQTSSNSCVLSDRPHTFSIPNLYYGWHIFTAEWDPWFITYKIDNNQIYRVNRFADLSGSDVIGCDAVMGVYLEKPYFPQGLNNYVNVIISTGVQTGSHSPYNSLFPPVSSSNPQMEVDYIRIYQRDPQPGSSDLCATTRITGSNLLCNSNSVIYNLSGPNSLLSWSVSPNLTVLSSNSSSITIQPTNLNSNSLEWVRANFNSGSPCNQTSMTKYIQVGLPAVSEIFLQILPHCHYEVAVLESGASTYYFRDGSTWHLGHRKTISLNGQLKSAWTYGNFYPSTSFSVAVKAHNCFGDSPIEYASFDTPPPTVHCQNRTIHTSFKVKQDPCSADGHVEVISDNDSPTAIHIWEFGDDRSGPIVGSQAAKWDYYLPYTDESEVEYPPVQSGKYEITHTVIEGVDTSSESMDVILSPPCCSMPNVISDNTLSSSLGSEMTSSSIEIQGNFIVDGYFQFANCSVVMDPGSKITVQPTAVFELDQSIIDACSNMWQGIFVENGATCIARNAEIDDAQYGINAADGSTIGAYNTIFNRDYVGIYVPENLNTPFFNTVYHIIDGCTFDCYPTLHNEFTGQYPSPGIKSFAGIQANGVYLSVSGLGTNINHFTNLNNGIVGNESDLNVANCDFNNIHGDPAYYDNDFNGTGIYLKSDKGDRFLVQTGFGLSGSFSFNNCDLGIYAKGVTIKSADNKMLEMDCGYRVDLGAYREIDIIDNYIRSNTNGIDLRMNDNAEHLLIQGNHIHFGSNNTLEKLGDAISIKEQGGENANSKINSNYIWFEPDALNAINGINMTSTSNYQVTNNIINMSDNLINQHGILTHANVFDEISCNNILGSGTNYDLASKDQSALKIEMGNYHNISCNNVNGTTNGIYFSGYCYNSDVKGNVFNNHKYGLHLDNYSIIGTQKFKGNKWLNLPSDGGLGAIYENEGNANSYQIVNDISTSPGQVVQPFSWSPSNWFDTGQGANFECQTNGLDYCSQFSFTPCEGCNQGFDLAVAENQIQNNEYTDESLYEFQKQLWNVLDLTSSYRDSFPELDSFYVANQYSLLAAVINVERTVFDLFDMAPSVIQTIKNNQIQIEADINSMKTHIDLILSNTLTPAQKITERTVVQALQNNIQTLSDYCTSALSIAKNSRILSADNINIVNGSIGDDEIYVTNDKLVNEIYLSTIAKGITFFDDEQILILEDIAQQCPLAGGNAVWRARSIYSLIDDQATYDDALACLNSGILLRKKHTDPNSLRPLRSSSIFPNPASDEATLTYSLPTDSKANLLISDEFGRDILHYTLDSKEAQFMFSTKLLNEGMYYYKIMVGDQIIEAGKISILR